MFVHSSNEFVAQVLDAVRRALNPKYFAVWLCVCALSGCATKSATPRASNYDSTERREHHDVFYSNWLRPSVSEEDKEFYYRSFLPGH